jgi:hypothetical protein
MILVEIRGGLGNQMFLYAVGRRIALEHQMPLLLDLTWFDSQELRSYRLSHFNIQAEVATLSLVDQFRSRRLDHRMVRFLRRLTTDRYRYEMIREDLNLRYHCDPSILNAKGNLYLRGYFQHPDYFAPITDQLYKEMTIVTSPTPQNREMLNQIHDVNSVSLHIRRGDFVSDEATNRTHGILPMHYYTSAISKIAERVQNPHFFIFSDDMNWVEQNLKLNYSMTRVRQNSADTDFEDLRLMMSCKHQIIANSSFSWWGAWLNTHNEKIVIAPSWWLAGDEIDTSGLIHGDWQIVEAS